MAGSDILLRLALRQEALIAERNATAFYRGRPALKRDDEAEYRRLVARWRWEKDEEDNGG